MKLPTKEELLDEYHDDEGSPEESLLHVVQRYASLAEREALERLLVRLRRRADAFEGSNVEDLDFSFRAGIRNAIDFAEDELGQLLLPATPATEQAATTAEDAPRSATDNPAPHPAGSQPSSSPPTSAALPWGVDSFLPFAPLTEEDVRRMIEARISAFSLDEMMRRIADERKCEQHGWLEHRLDKLEKNASTEASCGQSVEGLVHESNRALTERMVKIEDKLRALESPAPARESEDCRQATARVRGERRNERFLIDEAERLGFERGIRESVAWLRARKTGYNIDELESSLLSTPAAREEG